MRVNIESRLQDCRSKLEYIDRQIFEEISKHPGARRGNLLLFLYSEKKACSSALIELSALLQGISEPVIDNGSATVEQGKPIENGVLERKFNKTPINKKIYRIIMTLGGLGDVLLMTPAFRTLKQRDPNCRIYVYCLKKTHEEVLRNNRYIDRLVLVGKLRSTLYFFLSRLKLIEAAFPAHLSENGNNPIKAQFLILNFGRIPLSLFVDRSAAEVFAEEQLGIEVDDPRPNCLLTESEENEGRMIVSKYANPVAIQTTGKTSSNKNWSLKNWEELVSNNSDYSFIQLGSANEELIKGAVDLRGTSIRQAFAIVKAAKAFVGIDSVFAHAAAAFHIPSVVMFGPTTPAAWGYQWNQNLYHPPQCSPCLHVLYEDPCPYGKPCMSNIAVSQVENALRALSTPVSAILDNLSSPSESQV